MAQVSQYLSVILSHQGAAEATRGVEEGRCTTIQEQVMDLYLKVSGDDLVTNVGCNIERGPQ